MLDTLKPEYVSPLVLYLCHEDTKETGSLFECGGGWIGKVRWQKSSGAVLLSAENSGTEMTPEDGMLEKTVAIVIIKIIHDYLNDTSF
jgi:3-hydroxyacyl-CoA dehydrogenase/3a,7a,12a-trihydroxy-5b-cholest-24-enoyl-CoA hydratase